MLPADVYLDNNATTRPLPSVIEAMLPFLRDNFANPSSGYPAAVVARRAIEEARAVVADFIRAMSPGQIVFTSGGTESIGLALASGSSAGQQIIVASTEHASVQAAATRWSREELLEPIAVDAYGQLNLKQLEARVSTRLSFVSIAHANNETGIICDVPAIASICRKHGAVLHCDAVQSVGKLNVDVDELDCDFLSLSAHKFHGPKGIGVLYIRNPPDAIPLFPGHHEAGIRGGTENVAGIVGMAAAVGALSDWQADVGRIATLRDQLDASILAAIPRAALNAGAWPRLCNTTNIYLPQRDAADLVDQLGRRGVCVSAGAACSTGGEPSHVLQAMGLSRKRANSSLRFSLSRFTTANEVASAASIVADVYSRALCTF